MVEGARLEIVCAVIPYPGFKSLTLRQKRSLRNQTSFYFTRYLEFQMKIGHISNLCMTFCLFYVILNKKSYSLYVKGRRDQHRYTPIGSSNRNYCVRNL